MKQLSLLFALLLLLPSSQAGTAPRRDAQTQAAFFQNIKKLCGRTLEGATEFPPDPAHPLAGKRLVLAVGPCGEDEIRVPFHVGEDRSRTWILRLDAAGLVLRHDHRHPDGTPDEVTMYGGRAAAGGTARRQQFPADAETKKMIPDAATNVWTLELDEGGLVYHLERHGKPRYRAVFKLTPGKN
jgi:hypothetical protein